MIYVGVVSIIIGFLLTNLSGSFTKKFIRINNPNAHSYNATQMKIEWQRVAKEGGVVPSWVSLLSLGGWLLILGGITIIVIEIF